MSKQMSLAEPWMLFYLRRMILETGSQENSIQQDLMKSKENNQLENGYIGNT